MRVGPRRHRSILFVDGVLCLEGLDGARARLRPWPPEAVRARTQGGAWEPFYPLLRFAELERYGGAVRQLCLPLGEPARVVAREETERTAWASFVGRVPAEVRAVIGRHLVGGDWGVAVMVADCDGRGALELVAQAPAIAVLIARRELFSAAAVRERPGALVYRRQRELLGLCGFPATKAAVKLLGRLRRSAIRPDVLLELRAALADPPVARELAHLGALSAAVIHVARHPVLRAAVTFRFLRELAVLEAHAAGEGVVRALHRVVRFTAELPQARRPRRVDSLAQLRVWVNELGPRAAELRRAARLTFPPPPLPASDGEALRLEPIADAYELLLEGQERRNCIFSFADEIAAGRGALYACRVLRPERATLLLRRRGAAGPFEIADVRGFANRTARPGTVAAIQRWLEEVSPMAAGARERRVPTDLQLATEPPSREAIEELLAMIRRAPRTIEAAGAVMTLATLCHADGAVQGGLLAVAGDAAVGEETRLLAAAGVARAADEPALWRLRRLAVAEPPGPFRRRLIAEIARAELALATDAHPAGRDGPAAGGSRGRGRPVELRGAVGGVEVAETRAAARQRDDALPHGRPEQQLPHAGEA